MTPSAMTPTGAGAGQVWFLTGSQGLYGPEVVSQVQNQSRQIADALDAAKEIGFSVVWKPVLTSADGIRRMMLDANSDDDCIGLIAWMHTFSPAKMWISGLDALQKPLLHLHTQAGESLPWSEIDMDFMNLNQAAHGDREFGYIQTRLGVSRKTVAGHVTHPETLAAVGAWGRAARGAATIRSLRVARFGDNMRDVAVTEGDKVEAQRRFGVSVNTYGVNDLVAVVDQVDEAEIDSLVADYDEQYTVVPTLRPGGEQRDSLRYAARIEVGLRHFLQAGNFGAFTTNFEDLGGLRQLPGIAVQRLMADGYGFGGEGDWKTSVLLATDQIDGPGPVGWDLVHGGLHLPSGSRRGEDPRRPHARGLPDDRGRATSVRDPPLGNRRSTRSGPVGLRRRTRARRGGRPRRHG